jgi:putative transposase
MANHLRTELALDALNMALHQRRPANVIHHSDQGTQYTSIAFGLRCKPAGVRPSMGSVGDCYDNAMCESFFAMLECELIDRTTLRTHAEAKFAIVEFIEVGTIRIGGTQRLAMSAQPSTRVGSQRGESLHERR